MNNSTDIEFPVELGCLGSIPRAELFSGQTAIESMPVLSRHCGGAQLFVKRDDCTGLAFGGNKVRQLEFYLGEARKQNADTVLITGAVQSNFVRMATAGAAKLGMECHVQLEARVATDSPRYHDSGNLFLDKLLGAHLYFYPEGEDEAGADRKLSEIAADLRSAGRKTYIIPLAPGHAPLGALGYVVAAHELLGQLNEMQLDIDEIVVGSGSGATHSGLLFGLRALASDIRVTGVCVRRYADRQVLRIRESCEQIAGLLKTEPTVTDNDIVLIDDFLAPGYGVLNPATLDAIMLGAQTEGLMLDPVYTGKTFAALISRAKSIDIERSILFLHTGGLPTLFAYRDEIAQALENNEKRAT